MNLAPAPMSPGAPRAAVNPGVAPNVARGVMPNVNRGVLPSVRPNVNPGVRPNVFRGYFPANRGVAIRRPGRFGGVGSGLALAGIGLSLANDFPYPAYPYGGDDPYPGPGVGGPFEPYPPIIPAALPPQPCVKPLIIKVGQGLRRRTPTRVVYGSQPGCGRYTER